MVGQKLYVLTAPQDVADLYNKNTATVSWVYFLHDLYTWMGLSPSSLEKLWSAPTEEEKAADPARKCVDLMVAEYHHRQLLPGDRLDKLGQDSVTKIEAGLEWQNMTRTVPWVLEASAGSVKISLWSWCIDAFIGSTTQTYYGDTLAEVAPDLIDSFLEWEVSNWKYAYKYPKVLSGDLYAARAKIVGGFVKYFEQPQESRADATYFTTAVEDELKAAKFSTEDIAIVHMLHHWGYVPAPVSTLLHARILTKQQLTSSSMNGNVYKISFWIMAYILHDPVLLATIRAETAPGIINNKANIKYLVDSCPHLESLFSEVLRLYMSSALMRYVSETTSIGGKTLREGNKCMVPYRQLHYNTDVWGPSTHSFDAARFLADKSSSRNLSYRPFGGGTTLCPGRFVARHSIFAAVALMLNRYDVALDASLGTPLQPFPRVDEAKPGLGAVGPGHGDDVFVRLRPVAR